MNDDLVKYYDNLPEPRKSRLLEIRDRFMAVFEGAEESLKYKMPTFEHEGRAMSIGNQKKYLCVYFCCAELIKDIKEKHPKLSTGVGCVRIRDRDEIPFEELEKAFVRSMTEDFSHKKNG